MAPITRFEDIEGWQKSRDLQEAFTRAAELNPFKNRNLQDQMWRCTDSAMSNISEGFDAGSNPEFVRFLNMAYRSLTEFRSHLYECRIGNHLSNTQCDTFREMARQAQSKIGGFIRYLKAHPHGPPKKWGSGNGHPTEPNRTEPNRTEPRTNSEPRTKNSLVPPPPPV